MILKYVAAARIFGSPLESPIQPRGKNGRHRFSLAEGELRMTH